MNDKVKVYRLMEHNEHGRSKELFKTYNITTFENYLSRCIYNSIINYDPGCNYPSREQQVFMLCNDLQKGYEHFDGIDSNHWIDVHELNPSNTNDRDNYIRAKLAKHYEEAQSLGYEIFGIFVQGSQNYGLDLYTEEYWSDIDTKCIVLPSLDDIILNKKPISTTYERENKEHIDLKDIRLMWECFTKQNVNFMEILFTNYYIVPDKYKKYWDMMREMAEDIAHAHPAQTVRTMSGMSMEKYKALEHRYPTLIEKIDKYGYDGKQLHHIIRINDFIKRYTMNLTFKDCLNPTPIMIKQMNDAKLNRYSLPVARELAKKYDDFTKEIKDEFIKFHQTEDGKDIINQEVYDKMNQIKAQIMKEYFVEELKENEID